MAHLCLILFVSSDFSFFADMSRTVAVFSKHSTSLLNKLRELLPSLVFVEVLPSDLSPLKEAEIIVGDYNLIAPHLYQLPKLKWVQGTWAGLDSLWPHIDRQAPPKFPITRTSGENFGTLMREYVIANMVFWERNYFKAIENQKAKLYDRDVSPNDYRSIADLKVAILGVGSIGSIIGRSLKGLGATVYGMGRRATIPLEAPENAYLEKYYNKTGLGELLSSVDYIVNVLPKTPETTNILGNGMLKHCKNKNVVFINIGRGNVLTELELVQALNEKWISGAILDVFEKEPLPQESQLWTLPNVFITPHISGNSRAQDIAEKFRINLARFEKNEPLVNQVDFDKGY
ncbi:glyoxylate/hydroxypyruvate reductase A isoform X1 [Dendroctonus ponderosae]|nr:glyoxylate/hydroxypyruvate reductase A isoform X1 [Dendroctonus ponderosae]